jgi:hypothetical protein
MAEESVRITKQRDVRTHVYLWNASLDFFQRGSEQEYKSFYAFMASVVFTGFTLEAYLNWFGTRLFDHWNYLERLNPREKLDLILDHLGSKADYGIRPWQTLIELYKFRNKMAHGKPESLEESDEVLVTNLESTIYENFEPEWVKFCTQEAATRAREDVETIITLLHAKDPAPDGIGPFNHGLSSSDAQLI